MYKKIYAIRLQSDILTTIGKKVMFVCTLKANKKLLTSKDS